MREGFLDLDRSGPRLLYLAEAAAYLGISRSAVRQLVGNGQLSRVRLPGAGNVPGTLDRFLLDKHDLDAVIERGKEQ